MMETVSIKYKGLVLDKECTDEEKGAEMLLDQIIHKYDIPFSEEKVERELCAETAGFLQRMRYQAMGGNHQLEELDFEQWKKDMRKEIIRDYQIETILRMIIEQENLTVTSKELNEAATVLAEKEETTLEMVQRFMGEDYAFLKKDVLNKKAKHFLVKEAVRI